MKHANRILGDLVRGNAAVVSLLDGALSRFEAVEKAHEAQGGSEHFRVMPSKDPQTRPDGQSDCRAHSSLAV
jgi:hypothetical protein